MRGSSAALGILFALCLLSPALVGGVLPLWTPILCAAAALGCCLALRSAHGRGGRARLLPLLSLPAVAAALQLVPLPALLITILSPRAAQLRQGAGPLSLDAPGTTYELARALALLCLGVAAERLGAERRRGRLLLRALVIAGATQAVVTAVHLALRNTTSVLWLYALPKGWEMGLGTFVNRNHAASLLLLTCGATAGLLLEGARPRVLLGAALIAQLVTLGLSLSRGALCAAALFGAILAGAALRRHLGRGPALLIGLGGSALLGLLSVTLLPGFAARLQPILDGSVLHYQKVQVWRDALPLIADFWKVGTGRGAFQSAFPPYRTGDEYVTVPYAASLPLQQAAELGVPLALALWLLGAELALGVLRHRRRLAWAELGLCAGLGALLLHNLVDFGLELPGVSVPAVVALGVLVGRAFRHKGAHGHAPGPQVHGHGTWRSPQLAGASLAAAAAALLAVPAAGRLLSLDKARLRKALRDGEVAAAERLYQEAARRHPADAQVALLGAQAAQLAGQPVSEVLRRSNRALLLHPADAQAHRIAAHILSAMGRRGQAALELRLAFARGFMADGAGLTEAAAILPLWALPDAVPQHPDVQRSLATFLDYRGRPAEAALARRRAALLDPGW